MEYLNIQGIQNRIKLYSFFSLDKIDWAKEAVSKKSVFCNRMDKYNDIFDGKFYPNKDNLQNCSNQDNLVLKNIVEGIYDNNIPKYISIVKEIQSNQEQYVNCSNAQQVITALSNEYGEQYNFAQIYLDVCKKRNNDGANVLCHCFSEVATSLLMWSYYASSHAGLCLEYNLTTQEAIGNKAVDNLTKVNYCDNFPHSFLNGDFFFYKSREWAHEQEWRLVIDNKEPLTKKPFGKYIDFPFASAIYLGVNFPKEKMPEMREFCAKQGLKLFQMEIVPNKYAIEPKELKTKKVL